MNMSTISKEHRIHRQPSPARKLAEELRARKQGGETKAEPKKKLDGFGGVRGHTGPAPLGLMQAGLGAKAGGVTGATALLGAMTGDLQVKASEGPRLKKSGDGLVLTGDVTISAPKDLEILRGVEHLRGELVIEESALGGADLSALEGLRRQASWKRFVEMVREK